MRDVELQAMEPTGRGQWSGNLFTQQFMDTSSLQEFFEAEKIESTTTWTDAKNAIEMYVDANGIEPLGFPIKNAESQYLIPLLLTYLKKVGRFIYRRKAVHIVTEELLNHLDSPAPEVRGIVLLDGFSAARPFRLEPKMKIQPIGHHDLVELKPSEQEVINPVVLTTGIIRADVDVLAFQVGEDIH